MTSPSEPREGPVQPIAEDAGHVEIHDRQEDAGKAFALIQRAEAYRAPDEEYVSVGPVFASSRICVKCRERFVIISQDPSQICPRCTYATAWPTAPPEVLEAMRELRGLVMLHDAAGSKEEQHDRFVKLHDGAYLRHAVLLGELERIYGTQ